ncbi:urease accessory protein UreD [Aquibacillus sediminis]|uniref:urease accessory protein UreD n=1 Tax=Aquibacillus sediminis TaxID=2574734 RepID=UPI001109BB29|nr:urease accessory protein UreD [Aquibacillus sediminis]
MQALAKSSSLLKSDGKLELKFEKRRGKTRLIDCYQQPPLKASRGLYIDGTDHCTLYLMESSGGLVAGDHNEFTVHLKPGSNVTLMPQSATKVYPAFNDQPSSQQVTINLDEDARLEWNREEVIPFEDARFNSATSVQMTSSSSLLWAEILYPGREKRGETFAFRECHTHFEVWIDDDCLVYDALRLNPAEQMLKQLGVLEQFNYIANVWIVSPSMDENMDHNLGEILIQTDKHKSGITKLEGKGMLVRWISNDLPLLKKEVDRISTFIRKHYWK